MALPGRSKSTSPTSPTRIPHRAAGHSYFADRRPRFLVRRSIGQLGVTMKIEGREIIARN